MLPTAPSTGIIQRLAVKKAAAWDTAVACGAGDEVLMLTSPIKTSAPQTVDNSRGFGFAKDGTLGEIACSATLTMNLRYVGLDVLIAAFMGIAGAPTQQGATTAYKNAYKFNPDVYGIFVTLAKLMGPYIQEVPTAKVTGITVSGQVGPDPLQLAVDVVGSRLEIASLVNTLATFANVTLATGADKNAVLFAQTVFRMNSQSGAALGGGDTIYPSKFTLALKRNLKGYYTGRYRTATTIPQDLIDEPTNEGLPDLKLTLEFPTHTTSTYLSDWGNDARKKLDITSTGTVISGVYNFQHLMQLPHLEIINDDPTDGNGRIAEPVELAILGASASPTGMAGITDPLWWSPINTRTTDPLV